jgi:hypothetical protein
VVAAGRAEALGPRLDQVQMATTRRHEIMCETLTQFWRGTRDAPPSPATVGDRFRHVGRALES